MSGRCRKAASTRTKTPTRPRCASSTRKPISARWRSWARSPNGSPTTSRATSSAQAWGGKYRGQKQKWYALRFTGDDSEIDIANPGGGHDPEFIDWRWVAMGELPDLVVPFKRQTYERVVKEFEKFALA